MDKWASQQGTSSGRPQTAQASVHPPRPRYLPEVSTEVFAGEYGFELALQELCTDSPEMYMYSQVLNRLYCLWGKPCPVPMKVSSPPPSGSVICAMALYENRVTDALPASETAFERRFDLGLPELPVQVGGNQDARYFSDKETWCNSVTVPYEEPEILERVGGSEREEGQEEEIEYLASPSLPEGVSERLTDSFPFLSPQQTPCEVGSPFTAILYNFMFPSWCHPVLIVITLQDRTGQILGRGCFEVWVSCIPGLDHMRDEEKTLEGKTVVCENQVELIRCVSKVPEVLNGLIGDVLNTAQYEDIMSEPTDVLRMQKLFEEVLIGNEGYQARFYQVLQRTNRHFMNKLFGGHFVERHQKQLIEKVSGMDLILKRLLGFVLNEDDYRRIGTEETDAGMMAKLLELMPGWGRKQKDQLYWELIETNGPLITALETTPEEAEEGRREVYEACSSPFMSYGKRFVERHQEELIRCAVAVDVVVEFLKICAVITFHQMQDIRGTSQQQMQKLYELMPNWTTPQKDQMCEILSRTNRRLIMQLQGGHFVDRHREELIERVTKVPLNQLRGSALDEEQYEILLNCATEKMQMEVLFVVVQEWNRQQKDQLYRALAETNPDVVKELEEEHFIEKHEEEVIERACRVDTVLLWLREPYLLCISDPYCSIKAYSDQWKMRELYEQVRNWNRKQKDLLYAVLKKTNGPLIADLEEGHFVERHKEYLMKNIIGVRTVLSSLRKQSTICHHLYGDLLRKSTTKEVMEAIYKVVPSWNGEQKDNLYRALWSQNASLFKELESRKSTEDVLIPSQLADRCCLCEIEKDFSEVQPEHVPDAEGKLKTYRVHLPEAGTFLCPLTKLKFEVKAAVTIEYAHRSWDQHLSEAEMQAWWVAGPLFDIQTDAEEKVAAVHLPHFLCLGGGEMDISRMEIAHFVEAGLTLEKPARVTRFHAVLENPKFSLLGLLIKPLYDKFFCVHAVVMLYQILKSIPTLNLYLVPNDSSLLQAIQDAEEKFHSVLVRKPPQTITPLYYGSRYTVSSSADLMIIPRELHFTYKNPRQQQSYVQFSIRRTEIVDLSLKNKEDLCSVWDTSLEPEDLLIHTVPTEGERGDLDLNFRALFLGSLCDSNSQTEGTPVSSGAEGPSNQEENSDSNRRLWFSWLLELWTQATPSLEPHFIEKHRVELIERTTSLEGVLDLLHGVVLDEEQYQRISAWKTYPDKMRELYRLVPSWDCSCKDRLYEALRKKNPFLIADLERRMKL